MVSCAPGVKCGGIDGSIKPRLEELKIPVSQETSYLPLNTIARIETIPKPVKIAFIPLIVFLFILYLLFKD